MKVTFASHMTGAFRPVPQSCTSSTLLRHRPKSSPPYATLSSTFVFKQALIVIWLLLAAVCTGACARTLENPGSARNPYYKGFSYRIDENGDTIAVFMLNNITCFPPMKFKNKKQEEYYWRTVRDVRLTLPYAKLIAETLVETYEYIETFPTQKEREAYLKSMEKALFEQYKPVLKKFSRRQARVLVKLVQRETNQSSYDIVKAFLGSFRATFWQGFGKLFGVSLKSEFRPMKDKDDATLDRIATGIEEGWL